MLALRITYGTQLRSNDKIRLDKHEFSRPGVIPCKEVNPTSSFGKIQARK
jgi:hypothetical protein